MKVILYVLIASLLAACVSTYESELKLYEEYESKFNRTLTLGMTESEVRKAMVDTFGETEFGEVFCDSEVTRMVEECSVHKKLVTRYMFGASSIVCGRSKVVFTMHFDDLGTLKAATSKRYETCW